MPDSSSAQEAASTVPRKLTRNSPASRTLYDSGKRGPVMIFEVLMTMAAIAVVIVLVIAVTGRGVWRSLAERWRFEADVERRVHARFESAEADREAMKEQAREFVDRWFADKADLGEASGALTMSPMLRQVLEKHHADERVQALADRYKQATGKDLLPPELLEKLKADAAGQPESPEPEVKSKLAPEEEAAVTAARREVEAWVNVQASRGSS